jgi:hypothetical protein
MTSVKYLAVAALCVAAMGRDLQAQVPRNLDAVDSLYRGVSNILLAYKPVFGGNEMLVTFGTLGDEPELQVQFHLRPTERCAVWLRYVPRDQDTIYQRLFAVIADRPSVTPEQAAGLFRLEEEVRAVPCDETLGRLLARARDLVLPLASPVDDRTMFLHSLTFRVETHSPDFSVRAEFTSGIDLPVAAWARELRREVLRLLPGEAGAGANAPASR